LLDSKIFKVLLDSSPFLREAWQTISINLQKVKIVNRCRNAACRLCYSIKLRPSLDLHRAFMPEASRRRLVHICVS
jgi:hypothetical protein